MDIINPNLIGGQIAKLIADSTEKFYAVTAWLDLSNWTIILKELEQARKRGVTIKIFFRSIEPHDAKTLMNLGVELYQVKRLHTKFYLNEKEIIVSSMNFIETSDLYSIDIGIHYKDAENYNKFYHYFLKHINGKNSDYIDYLVDDEKALKDLQGYLSDRFTDSRINHTQTGNYLFSRNLIPVFDIFIMPSEITLKYPTKKPDADKIKELTSKISSTVKKDIKTKEPHENYDYCTWDISISNHSTTDLVNIITDLRQLK